MEKLNLAKLLKDCPTGMELDSTLFEGLEFDCIVDNEYLPIRCRIKHPNGGYTVYNFTKYGCWLDTTFAKCVIFPKGKTTWEGFERLFKDGDMVATFNGRQIFIFKENIENVDNSFSGVCYFGVDLGDEEMFKEGRWRFARLANEEEKQKLFDAIKANGYKWNAETKTLEKLIVPKFKVGDRIKCRSGETVYRIVHITEDSYVLDNLSSIYISIEHMYDLVPNKFDITTLKAFESKVLVRDVDYNEWEGAIFGRYDGKKFFTIGGLDWGCCIPYEGNEHLLGTTDDCDEYYKTWE